MNYKNQHESLLNPNLVAHGQDGNIYFLNCNASFDKYSIPENLWSVQATSTISLSYGSAMTAGLNGPAAGQDGYIYVLRGNGYADFGKYWILGNTWTTGLAGLPVAPYYGSAMVADGNGNIYALGCDIGRTNCNGFYKYNIAGNSWSTLATTTANVGDFGISLAYDNGNIYATPGGGSTAIWKYVVSTNTWTTLTNAPGGISYGALTTDGSGSIYVLQGNAPTFWKYAITGTVTPTLTSITVSYPSYPASQTLTSSPYNTGSAGNTLSKIQWTATTPTNTSAKFQMRTAPDSAGAPGTWTNWLGPDNTSSTYFVSATGTDAMPSTFTTSTNNQWIQYKTFLTSTGASTPTLASTTVTYVVNAPPDFDVTYGTNGVSVLQNTSSTDPNYGKVQISYKIRDVDTLTDTVNSGFISLSFQYSLDNGITWTAITSSTLAAGDLNNKAVTQVAYNTYTANWNAASQIPGTYSTAIKVRVTVNDNEAANNTATAVSSAFALDAKQPAVTTFSLSGVSSTVTINLSDNNNISYILSNNSDYSADGLNAISGTWQNVGNTSTSTSLSWTASSTYPTVYLQVKDTVNNSTSTSVTAPYAPANLDLKDVSNVRTNTYKLFLSWGIYTPTSTSPFGSYKVYRSTDGTSFPLLTTITDVNLNYYADASVASSTTYYYKVLTADSNGNTSPFTNTLSKLPNGFGGTDVTAPTITNVSVTSTQSTWAKITWTTDKLSDSKIEYNAASSTPYALSSSVNTMVISHTLTLVGLTPNTNYKFRVKSTDVSLNVGTNDNSGAGYTFTTTGGPTISNVAITAVSDKTASITWNTDKDSDSYIVYSTNASFSGSSQVGSAALVGIASSTAGLYQHTVNLTGLTQSTLYYYYVKSTDGLGNLSTDTNSNNYYTFQTTRDVKPPVILNISTPVLASTAAVVVWTTDKLASSQVSYGTVTGSYSASAPLTEDTNLTISHVESLTGLNVETKYYFIVRSSDANGNTTSSPEQTFTTTKSTTVIIASTAGGAAPPPPQEKKDTTPPAISGISVNLINAFGATVNFITDKPAIGIVMFGKDSGYGNNSSDPDFSTNHSISLTGLQLGATYHFSIKAIDKNGNIANAPDQTFKTKYFAESIQNLKTVENASQFQSEVENSIESILPSILPPFIEAPQVSNITENSAIITWKTNIKAFSTISYAETSAYDSKKDNPYIAEVSDVTNKTTSHSLQLIGLKPNTEYHFMAKSFSLPQAAGTGPDMTFITKASKVQANIAEVKTTSFKAVWTTDEPATSIVEYKNIKTGEINRKIDNDKKTYHDALIDNLTPGTRYEVSVSGYNNKGNLLEAGSSLTVTTSVDITPPVISGFKVDNALVPGRNDRIQTIVSWITDKLSNSIVYYQEGTSINSEKEFANKVELLDTYTSNHAMILSNLKPGTIYQVKVISTDQSGNRQIFGPRTIITPQQTQSIFDVIFKNFEDTFKFLRNVQQ